jgi:hypothetical protein
MKLKTGKDKRLQAFKTLPVIPPLKAESSTWCNLIVPHVTPPLVDASGETVALRGLSLSHSWSLDGNAWSRRGTMTYPRIPTKSEAGALEEKYTMTY